MIQENSARTLITNQSVLSEYAQRTKCMCFSVVIQSTQLVVQFQIESVSFGYRTGSHILFEIAGHSRTVT